MRQNSFLARLKVAACLIALCAGGSQGRAAVPGWTLSRSEHFEIYSKLSPAAARSTLAWLEQLRSFLIREGGDALDRRAAVRVIGFPTVGEYNRYRLRPGADAFYVGTEQNDYIALALPEAGPAQFRVLAHEYAHVLVHSGGLRWPAWFGEGFAEFLSTLHVNGAAARLGGEMPGHSLLLRRESWVPLSELFTMHADSAPPRDWRQRAKFYAQSWALVEMLVVSPDYAKNLPALLTSLAAGTESAVALTTTYAKPLSGIDRDLRRFVAGRKTIVEIASPEKQSLAVSQSAVSSVDAQAAIAELMFISGDLKRAEALYGELAAAAPGDGRFPAALSAIAFRKGDAAGARELWNSTMRIGIDDAAACYRYAISAETAGVPLAEVRPVLERAVTLDAAFDEARYRLAQVDNTLGDYEAAVTNLRKMRAIAPPRAFAYWTLLSDSLNELNRKEEAMAAAVKAVAKATTPEQRQRAEHLAHVAQTDLAVQLAPGGDGQSRMVAVRKPHDADNWNPFIAPGESIRRIDGKLLRVDCEGDGAKVLMDSSAGPMKLTIADPARVQMRNAPASFTCGPQPPAAVTVEYVASGPQAGTIRGMVFR